MKFKLVYIGLIGILISPPAPAQEFAGNWWANPRTGTIEQFDFETNQVRQIAQTQPRSANRSDAVILGQVQGGDTLIVHGLTQRTNRYGSYWRTQAEFRIPSTNRRRFLYTVDINCDQFSLTQTEASTGEKSTPALTPGTAARAIFDWACPQ